MTLSALSGSAVGATVLGLAYVFGMTFPLFVMALAWDRFDLGRRSWLQAKPVTIPLPRGRALHNNSVNLIVAAAFTVIGVFVLRLASSGTMTSGPGMQVAVGDWLASVFRRIEDITAPVPEPILGAALLGLVAVFVVAMLRRRGEDPDLDDDGGADVDPHASCHPAAASTTTSHDQESSS